MAERVSYATLAQRTKILSVNSLIFYVAFIVAAGRWLPTGGLESVWLLSAIALWLLSLLSAPWFIPPRDALANAIGAICILVTMELDSVPTFRGGLEIIRWLSVFHCMAVASTAIASLFIHDQNPHSPIGRMLFRLTAIFGKGELFYTPAALISILGAYQSSFPTIASLIILWGTVIFARLPERIFEIVSQWQLEKAATKANPAVGSIERIDDPNIVRIRLAKGASWKSGTLHVAAMSDGEQSFVLGLFTQVQGTEVMGTGLCVAQVDSTELLKVAPGFVYASHDQDKCTKFIENLSGSKNSILVGFTVEGSTIGTLKFEIAATSELAEGDVVFTKIAGEEIFYQILDAETSEENFDQNPRGTHIVRAAQLGSYDPLNGFKKYPWLPKMNTPLFYAKDRKFEAPKTKDGEFVIGNVPSTNIGVVANIHDLIQYHTAVLGVTGTGKTEMALDIVREALAHDVKVFCVDFTGEYRARLADKAPIFPTPSQVAANDLTKRLFDAETGEYNAGAEKKALDEALKTMRIGVTKEVGDFLHSETNSLAILELAEVFNSKTTLRLTELYLSAIMTWARQNRRAREVLVVLEEAHTIIPEAFGAGFDHNTQWVVSRIGQIALQGRKYGVGLLVLSQRTALVSKTILSQCHTFLTHSLIDQTSLNFLESVYSFQHTKAIPNLGQFEFLAYGKALRAERPILLKREFDPRKKEASDKLNKPLAKQQGHATETAAPLTKPIAATDTQDSTSSENEA